MGGECVAEGLELGVVCGVCVQGPGGVFEPVWGDWVAVGPVLPGVECVEALGVRTTV